MQDRLTIHSNELTVIQEWSDEVLRRESTRPNLIIYEKYISYHKITMKIYGKIYK